MKKKINLFGIYLLPLIFIFAVVAYGADDKTGNKLSKQQNVYKTSAVQTGKVGDAYRLFINNINLPLNRKGIIAAVNILDPNPQVSGPGGKYAGDVFLFSSGFFLSGTANGTLWANAVASASLVEDYVPGTVQDGQGDPRAQLYVVKSDEPAFSQSWLDWADAVALGADFYDGNNDGQYNPTDLNGNGLWDPEEDRPDLIGDATAWCVYSDGLPAGQRRWNTVNPLGIEVRQTVFAFASSGAIGNIIFVRYRFKYVGLGNSGEPERLDDVYFGVWADPDIGDANDDLSGSDLSRNVGFTYNDGPDVNKAYGSQPPAYFIDFFSGPVAYVAGETYTDNDGNGEYNEGIDTPLDTAYSVRGQVKGKIPFPGAKNLGLSSFVQYINGDPTIPDPNNASEARNYMLGLPKSGTPVDPCTFGFGVVLGGVDCATIDNRYWYSGDPVTQTGWINNVPADIRQMQNIGPFVLNKNEEKEVVVAYVVGQGSDARNSISVTRQIDDGAQTIFDNNFLAPSPPPTPQVEVSTGEDFIDLTWKTETQLNYRNQTSTYDLQFRGYNVYAYRTATTSDEVNGLPNQMLVATYQLDDFISDLYRENGATGGKEILYPASSNRLDPQIYSDPETGRIRIRITKDPFTGGDLIKGKPYFFSVTSYAINHDALVPRLAGSNVGDFGDYYLSANTFVQSVENIETMLDYNNRSGIVVGEDLYSPPIFEPGNSNHIAGKASGEVDYVVVNKEALTGNQYSVEFFKNQTAQEYSMLWRLINTTTGTTLIDSSNTYDADPDDVARRVVEGFIPKVEPSNPDIGTPVYQGTTWYDPFSTQWGLGVYYVGADISGEPAHPIVGARSKAITADQLRRVELRFGTEGKAYRYLNGYIGNAPLQQRQSYQYAAGVTAADTTGGKGSPGKFGQGFVDVPFTAWVVDSIHNEERQLAVGFIEKRVFFGGNPDGEWNPMDSLLRTGEVIVIFNSEYDPNGGQVMYTGNEAKWADLIKGFDLVDGSATPEQIAISKSPWFNAMYVVGLQQLTPTSTFTPGDKLIIPMTTYPYTEADKYAFTTPARGALTDEAKRELFNKVNVFPNPLYGFNIGTSYSNQPADDPYVTFSNLPENVTVKIYSLSGILIRTLTLNDKTSADSPFLNWDLQNESGLRVASGLYLAIVSSPEYGEKILKFSIIMPQKQIQRY